MIDDLRRVHAEARESRMASLRLRRDVRRRARRAEETRLRAAQNYRRAQRLRACGVQTAWSTLRWSPPGADLNEVLELVA